MRKVVFLPILIAYITSCSNEQTKPATTTGYIPVANSKLYYETTGNGKPILFLHGGFMDRRMWAKQVAEFSKDHQVITCDLRGHGLTVNGDSSYFMYEAVRMLLDSLHITKADVAGLSLGAIIAVDLALEYPQYVDKLILCGPGLNKIDREYEQDSFMNRASERMRDAIVNKKDTALAINYFIETWFDGPQRKPSETDTAERAKALQMGLGNADGHHFQYWTRFAEPPAIRRLQTIKSPTLIILGEKDVYRISVNADTLQAYIPGATRIVIPGTAHMMNMEKPVEFNKAVRDFISK